MRGNSHTVQVEGATMDYMLLSEYLGIKPTTAQGRLHKYKRGLMTYERLTTKGYLAKPAVRDVRNKGNKMWQLLSGKNYDNDLSRLNDTAFEREYFPCPPAAEGSYTHTHDVEAV